MAKYDGMKPGEILADASVAEFISSLGLGIAAAQQALDENTISQLGQFSLPREGLGNRSLLDLGLMPAFYHYQYADISCSMQIRLEVGKSFEIGGQASLDFNSGNNSTSQNSLNQNSEESASSTTSINRTAEMKYHVTQTGGMSLNGASYTATGATPALRLKNLREQLLGNASSNIEALVYEPPITTPPVLTDDAADDKVFLQSPFVTFLKTTVPYGFIWMKANQDTDYIVNNSTTISTVAAADLATYASSVRDSFRVTFNHQEDFVSMFTPQMAQRGDEFNSVEYDTGVSELEGDALDSAVLLANLAKYINLPVEIEGFTDRVGSNAKNLELGKSRANRMKDVFIAHGVNASSISIRPSREKLPPLRLVIATVRQMPIIVKPLSIFRHSSPMY
ncbi:OmpA family protein [uncultured Psychromonas sp.]|uniref:OmpA family protein n=1 Tax=uncultured Psychromonas sp. TaxID=173974 RepID=UPI00261B0171|nr:OmpA family protein [uncultured Psychromonas sp.]